ncbi:hypothetical protein BCL57_001532 [Agromyces flavus]|uniref:Uncharacterized protein n=1 Tax=Agromyces flavus TaxID=589382 RepID=A0A1H2A1V8_9MICO|nr:hypothetical protein [Agromyces flavus]MCP2367378.1 hypothetical protein [Agromyces flavus]GGI45846.1 hypothetical protein GCM10010932_11630 [Agromyces flavus]SDT39712.1 hypothetical protein SAMN04489721_3456 [Agromyces flavus]
MTSSDAIRGIPVPERSQPRGRSLRWRREQLIAAGLDEFTAHRLAKDAAVDVHAIIVSRERSRAAEAGRGGDGRSRGE